MMNDVFRINEADNGSDSLEAYQHGGRFTIEIEEPWAGSTETGFGQTCSISLTTDEALRFGEWLVTKAKALCSTP